MIAFIEGDLIECQLNMAVIQVGGIGYQVNIPLTTSERLPSLGKEIKLYTQATYREDSQTLYGFIDRESRDFFRMIVDKVSGIGPRIALNLLGSLSLPMLKSSIASGDVGMLSKAQGLGKKTAERIIVELKDKVLKIYDIDDNISFQNNNTAKEEALSALEVLGINKKTSEKLVDKIMLDNSDASVEFVIKEALKKL